MLNTLVSHGLHRIADVVLQNLNESTGRGLMILTVTAVLLSVESPFARKEGRSRDYRQSYLANFGMLMFNDTLLSILSVTSLWAIASRYSGWGLLSGIQDVGVKALLSFVLLDLTLYLWHRANHQFDGLWRFHKVHHSDRVMNVSTAFRLHGVEVFLTVAVKALFIVVVGVDATLVIANEALITLCVLFHHARIHFRGERLLGRLAIMPYLHRTHHSVVRAEHDSNYGAVFSCWDRLFGTLSEAEPEVLGLFNVPGQNLLALLKFGFARNAPAMPARTVVRGYPLHAMIAEAAYYRAERRGFAPGDDFRDWLEAEREFRHSYPRS
jgi:sterol desaturase/sphingolipid hydroxylase (fatty acid hydroxylase superfamily)